MQSQQTRHGLRRSVGPNRCKLMRTKKKRDNAEPPLPFPLCSVLPSTNSPSCRRSGELCKQFLARRSWFRLFNDLDESILSMQSRKLIFLPVKDLKGILYTDCNFSESDPAPPDCGGGWLVSYLHTREGDRQDRGYNLRFGRQKSLEGEKQEGEKPC